MKKTFVIDRLTLEPLPESLLEELKRCDADPQYTWSKYVKVEGDHITISFPDWMKNAVEVEMDVPEEPVSQMVSTQRLINWIESAIQSQKNK